MVPVPLHPLKERDRGFNQAERLAKGVAEHLNLPIKSECLMRFKYTETQTNLSRKERMANMQNAFGGSERMTFSRVLLVDDVMTTGRHGKRLRGGASASRSANCGCLDPRARHSSLVLA